MDFIIPTACRRESAGKTGSTKASKDTGHWPVLPDKRCRSRSTISRCITFVTQFGHYEQKLSTLQSPTLTYSEERGRYGDVKRIPLSLSLPVWSAYALHCAVLTSTGPGFAASSSVYTSLIPPPYSTCRGRYWIASATWTAAICSTPVRSAIVRARRRIR